MHRKNRRDVASVAKEKRKFQYKWVIFAVSILMVLTSLGFCSSSKDLYLSAITEALDIERSGFALNDSIRFIATAVVNLFFGALVARFGAKKLVLAGFGALIASCLTYSFATQLWQFYIGGALLGIGLSWCTTTMVGYVVGKWFASNKGTVMGVILASNGLGSTIAIQVVVPIIEASAFGYRTAYRLIALLLLCVALLVLAFYREAPAEPESPAAKPGKKKRGADWVGMTFAQASKKPYVYLAAVCIFLTGTCLQGVAGIKSANLKDMGMGSFVASVASVYSLCLIGTKFLAGFSFDKLGLRLTLLLCHTMGAAAILMMALMGRFPFSSTQFYATAAHVLLSVAMPLETIMLPLISAELFGKKDYARIMGLVVSVNTAGYAVGPWLTNLGYDLTGSYRVILLILAGVMAAITLGFQFTLILSQRDRRAIEAAEAV